MFSTDASCDAEGHVRLGSDKSGRSYRPFRWCAIRARVHGERDSDEDGVSQVKEEGDREFEYVAHAVGA